MKQLITPRDGVAQGLLSCWHVPRPTCQHVQWLVQAREQRLWREQLQARRCQLDGQWKPIQTNTHLCHCPGVGRGQLEPGPHRLRTLEKQRHRWYTRECCTCGEVGRIGQCQRRHGEV